MCLCLYDSDTGYFNACCQQHEDEYVTYLQQQKAQRELEAAARAEGETKP